MTSLSLSDFLSRSFSLSLLLFFLLVDRSLSSLLLSLSLSFFFSFLCLLGDGERDSFLLGDLGFLGDLVPLLLRRRLLSLLALRERLAVL